MRCCTRAESHSRLWTDNPFSGATQLPTTTETRVCKRSSKKMRRPLSSREQAPVHGRQRRSNITILHRFRVLMTSRPSGAPICSCNQGSHCDHGCHPQSPYQSAYRLAYVVPALLLRLCRWALKRSPGASRAELSWSTKAIWETVFSKSRETLGKWIRKLKLALDAFDSILATDLHLKLHLQIS